MKRELWRLCGVVILTVIVALGCAAPAQGADPFELSSEVEVAVATRSNLIRETNRVATSAQVTLRNIGTKPIEGVLHLLVDFDSADSLDGLEVVDAIGGIGEGPYQTFYFDLSTQLPAGGLPAGVELVYSFSFSRPVAERITFALRTFGLVNRDPLAVGPPALTVEVGEMVDFDSTGSSDPDGDAISVEWDFGDGDSSTEALASKAFATPGVFEARLSVTDGRGGAGELRIPVAVSPGGEFALARTRTLDGVGHPLGGVSVRQASGETQASGEQSGFVSLGGTPGSYVWKFSKPGHFPVWRTAELEQGEIGVLPSPWMLRREASASVATSVLQAAVLDLGGGASITVPPEAFPQPTQLRVFELGGQTLPLPLPLGWSPLRALAIDAASGAQPAADLRFVSGSGTGQGVNLVRFREESLDYEVLSGDSLDRAGIYLLVSRDTGAPAAVVGAALAGVDAPGAGGLVDPTAQGTLDPEMSVASRKGNKVTSRARVTVTNSSAESLPSGMWFRSSVAEDYRLSGGGERHLPDYDTTFFAYRQPAGTPSESLVGDFPLRPRVLYSASELLDASVRVAVLGDEAFMGGIITTSGGVFSGAGVRMTVPPGAVGRLAVGELRALALANFGSGAVRAFELNLEDLLPGQRLGFAIGNSGPALAAGKDYVLVRVAGDGLVVVDRLATDAAGSLSSNDGGQLTGIDRAGQYALLEVAEPFGIVGGAVSDAAGDGVAGAKLSLRGTQWLAFSNSGGTYKIALPTRAGTLAATHPNDGTGALEDFDLISASQLLALDLTLRPIGPSVVEITPTDGATRVRRGAVVSVKFSSEIDAASFGATGLALREKAGGVPVSASLSLGTNNTLGQLFPTAPLFYQTEYEILVSATITNDHGLPLEGTSLFSFKTEAPPARGVGAELVIYEPGAANVPPAVLERLVAYVPGSSQVVCHGGPGTADTEVPVILVNENSGETATVLSDVDGSFASYIDADEEDFVEAVFINANGTRVAVPATKQLFDTGQIGLYRYGGILEAQGDGGPVQVIIEPEAIDTRTKFSSESLNLVEVLDIVRNQLPENGGQILGGLRVTTEGDDLNLSADIKFPIDSATLNLDPGVEPEDASYALVSPLEIDGVVTYQIIDRMHYEAGELVTHSPPFLGALFAVGGARELSKTIGNTNISHVIGATNNVVGGYLGIPSSTDVLAGYLVMPVMMSQGTSTVVRGLVRAAKVDDEGMVIDGTDELVVGAVIAANMVGTGNYKAGRPNPGAYTQISGPDGDFAFYVPVALDGGNYTLNATHPRFPFQVASGGAAIGGLQQRFFSLNNFGAALTLWFAKPDPLVIDASEDNQAPFISIAHQPRIPKAGTSADSGATMIVSAIDGTSVGGIQVSAVQSISAGAAFSSNAVVVTEESSMPVGPNRVENRYTITSEHEAKVLFDVTASDGNGNTRSVTYAMNFALVPPPPPDPNADLIGPLVTWSWPLEGASGVVPEEPVLIKFSEAIDPGLIDNPGSWLTLSAGFELSALDLSPDGTLLTVYYAPNGSGTSTNMELAIGNSVTDLSGKLFDQNPESMDVNEEAVKEGFQLSFSLAPAAVSGLSEVDSGGGVAAWGGYAFVVERRGARDGALLVYDISDPGSPSLVGSLSVPGNPRDLTLVPNWSYRLKPGGQIEEKTLVVVAGGRLGSSTAASAKYLWVIDVSDPTTPTRVTASVTSFSPANQINKIVWAPPFIAYQDADADVTSIQVIDLQAMIIGNLSTAAERDNFPDAGQPGVDLNGDGDYTDAGDAVPLPIVRGSGVRETFGKIFSFATLPRERYLDFSFDPVSGGLGVTIDRLDGGAPVFQTLIKGLRAFDPEATSFDFPVGSRPKRVLLVSGVALETNTGTKIRDLALVSLAGGIPRLAVLDVSDPENPTLLNEIALPAGYGFPQSAQQRSDGFISLATTSHLLVLDPARLAQNPLAGATVHPAITAAIPGAGSGARSYISETSGINLVSLGGKNQIIQTEPLVRMVSFRDNDFISAGAFSDLDFREKNERFLGADIPDRLLRERAAFNDSGAATSFDSSAAEFVYYVRIDAPGGSGEEIDLFLDSLDTGGNPIADRPAIWQRVRLGTTATLGSIIDPMVRTPTPADRLRARRLSDDQRDPYFNVYLSDPIILTRRAVEPGSLPSTTKAVRPGQLLWVGFDPAMRSNDVIDLFASRISSSGNSGSRVLPGTAFFREVDNPPVPLIFIPGIAGTHLERTGFGDSILSEAWPGYTRLLQSRLSLDPSDFFQSTVVASDIIREIPEAYNNVSGRGLRIFGATVEIYKPMINYLTGSYGLTEYSYVPLKDGVLRPNFYPVNMPALRTLAGMDRSQIRNRPDLFVYPYDWRKSNAESADMLEEYIEVIRVFYPDLEQIDILAHSMGGLVARRFAIDHPGLVRKLVTVGSPFLGAPKAIMGMETGDMDDLAFNLIIRKGLMKDLARYFPGAQELMPSEAYFINAPRSPIGEQGWDFNGDGMISPDLSYDQFMGAMDMKRHPESDVNPVLTNENFHGYTSGLAPARSQDDWSADPASPGDAGYIEFYHLHGVQSIPKTVGRVVTTRRVRATPLTAIFSGNPLRLFQLADEFEVERVSGDGTVPTFSATKPGLNAPGAVLLPINSNGTETGDKLTEHNGLMGNPEVHDLIRKILTDEALDPSPPTADPAVTVTVRITNAQPGTIQILNPDGSEIEPYEIGESLDDPDATGVFETAEHRNAFIQAIDGDSDVDSTNTGDDARVVEYLIHGGAFQIRVGYDEVNHTPITIRIERNIDDVPQELLIWRDFDLEDFIALLATQPVAPQQLSAQEGELPVAAVQANTPVSTTDLEMGIGVNAFAGVGLPPATVNVSGVNNNLTAIFVPPDISRSGEDARDTVAPVELKWNFTEGCNKMRFYFADDTRPEEAKFYVAFSNPASVMIQIDDGIFEFQEFSTNIANGEIYVCGTDGAGNVSPTITVPVVGFCTALRLEVDGDIASGTTDLVAELYRVELGTAPVLQPGAEFFYLNNGATSSIAMPGGRLTLSTGPEFNPSLVFPIEVIGLSALLEFAENLPSIDAHLRDVYQDGRNPSPEQRRFLDLVTNLGGGLFGAAQQTVALTPSAHGFCTLLESAADSAAIDVLLGETRVEFVNSDQDIEGRSVQSWLPGIDQLPEAGGDPWLPLGFLPPPPPVVVTTAATRVDLRNSTLPRQAWNPGRSARAPAGGQRMFTGLIMINEDLQRRAQLGGGNGETIHFLKLDGTIGQGSALQSLKAEIYHEMNVRFWDIRGQGEDAVSGYNLKFDEWRSEVLYPQIHTSIQLTDQEP